MKIDKSIKFGHKPTKTKHRKVFLNTKAAFQLINRDLDSAVVMTKMGDMTKDKPLTSEELMDSKIFGKVSSKLNSKEVACNYLKMFPELKTALVTLVSLTLSPRNTVLTEIIYGQKRKVLPGSISAILTKEVSSYIEANYSFKSSLYDILSECAMGAGSVAYAVIPENSLDDIINGKVTKSVESLAPLFKNNEIKQLGFLGDVDETVSATSLESLLVSHIPTSSISQVETIMGLEVIDNYNMMKLPSIIDKDSKRKREVMGHHLFGRKAKRDNSLIRMKTYKENERHTIGKPFVMKLDTSSLVLVTSPTDKTKRLGAFVLINKKTGMQVTKKSKSKSKVKKDKLLRQLNSSAIGREFKDLGEDKEDKNNKLSGLSKLYMRVGVEILKRKMINGLYQTGVSIDDNQALFDIALSRSLANQGTQLVFLPNEILSYFALDFNADGSGKNLLEDYNDINALRAGLLYSEVQNTIINNMLVTEATISVDENDPDPRNTKDIAQAEILKGASKLIPPTGASHGDLVGWMREGSIRIKYDTVPGLPSTTVTTERLQQAGVTGEYAEVNEKLRSQVLTGVLGDPSMMDEDGKVEFASVEEDKQMIAAKRIRGLQVLTEIQATQHIHRLILHDGNLRGILGEIIKSSLPTIKKVVNLKDTGLEGDDELEYILELFATNMELRLPSPIAPDLEKLSEQLDNYISSLENYLPFWISERMLDPELDGELAENADRLTEGYMSLFVRNWMASNDFMTELSDIVSLDSIAGQINLGKEMAEHKKGLFLNVKEFIEESVKNEEKYKEIRKKKEEEENAIDDDDGDDFGGDGGDPGYEVPGGGSGDDGDDFGGKGDDGTTVKDKAVIKDDGKGDDDTKGKDDEKGNEEKGNEEEVKSQQGDPDEPTDLPNEADLDILG